MRDSMTPFLETSKTPGCASTPVVLNTGFMGWGVQSFTETVKVLKYLWKPAGTSLKCLKESGIVAVILNIKKLTSSKNKSL